MKKKLLSSLLAFMLCVGLLPVVASAAWNGTTITQYSGSGTESSPYVISSEANLAYFAQQLNAGTKFEGQYLKLAKNLDMTSGTWNTKSSTFAGTFLGNGYTITLNGQFLYTISGAGKVDYLNLKSTETTTTPLLCYTNNGTIQNCRVRGDVTNTVGDAALLCHTNNGMVLNSCGFGSLSGCGDDSDCYVGWIAKNSGTVRSCYTVVSLSARAPGSDNDAFTGGIAASNGGTYENCYTGDAVAANDTGFLERLNQVGISGYVWSADSSSANEGYPVIKNCLDAETQLSASSDSMFAYHSGSLTTKITCSLTGCTIYYTIDGSDPRSSSTRKSLSSTSSLIVTGDTIIRTVAYKSGSYSRPITQYAICLPGSGTETSPYEISTNLGLYAVRFEPEKVYRLATDLDFTGETYVHNGVVTDGWESIPSFSGTLRGDRHSITGLCGSTGGLVDSNSGTIQELRLLEHQLCRESWGEWNSTAGNFGAVANSNSGTITRCYAASDTSVVLQTKISVYSITGVGGIVGWNYSGGTISYCYSSGDLRTASAASPPVPYMGGIAGYNAGTIQSCYSDINIYSCYTSHDMGSIVGGITTGSSGVFDCRFDGTCTIRSYMIHIGIGIAKYAGGTVSSYRCYDGGATFTPTGADYRIYRSTEYDKYETTNSGADRLESSFPKFDFATVWMITEQGPMPQGIMQADGNYYTKVSYTAPTTSANGETVCAVNGTSETKTFVLSALENDDPCASGHSFTSYVSNNDATCTADGTKTAKCDNCDATDTIADEGSKKNHSFTDYKSNNDATCTADGTKTAKCDNCDATDTVTDEGSKKNHSFTKYESNNDATCTADGTKTAKCDNCDATDTIADEGSKKNHSFTDYKSNNDATCTADGTKTAKCDNCDATNTIADEGSATGHDFSNNAEYCRNGCGTKNPNYTAPVMPPYMPVRPIPTPVPTPVEPERPENPFTDVSKDDYFFDAVIWAVENGITSGTSATTFDPNKVCTRAEMVTFLWRAAGKPEPISRNNPFTDVTETDYFYRAVLWAVENGITKGTGATTFSPNDTCTRAQAATFLYRYAGSPEMIGVNPFADVQETDYFYHAVIWAAEEKITKGTSATTFSPDDFCTRAQIVTFLYRYQDN